MRICISSVSRMGEIASCPLSPIADDLSALPSPPSSLSCSQYCFLPVHSMPAPVFQLACFTNVPFRVFYCKIKNVVFIFKIYFYLEVNCFTILCWFLPYIKMSQPYIFIYVLSLLNLPPTPPAPLCVWFFAWKVLQTYYSTVLRSQIVLVG